MRVLSIIAISLVFVGSIHAKGLKTTSKEFTKLLAETEVSEDDFIERISGYIIPHAKIDSLCFDYYEHWKELNDNNFFAKETKIEKITKHSDESAVVLIANVWACPNGEEYYSLTQTSWVKRGNNWYRTTSESEVLVEERIDTEATYSLNEE